MIVMPYFAFLKNRTEGNSTGFANSRQAAAPGRRRSAAHPPGRAAVLSQFLLHREPIRLPDPGYCSRLIEVNSFLRTAASWLPPWKVSPRGPVSGSIPPGADFQKGGLGVTICRMPPALKSIENPLDSLKTLCFHCFCLKSVPITEVFGTPRKRLVRPFGINTARWGVTTGFWNT